MRHSCIILRLCIYIDVKTVMFFKTFRGREMTIWNRCFACPIEFWHHSWSDFLPRQQKTTHQLTSLLYRLIYFCHVTFFNLERKVSSESIMWKFYTIFGICHIVFFLNWFDDLPYWYLNLVAKLLSRPFILKQLFSLGIKKSYQIYAMFQEFVWTLYC